MTTAERPGYGLPPAFIAGWLLRAPLRRGRDAGVDGARLLRGRVPAPVVIGLDLVPASGPFILVMNHYESTGIRVWWPVLHVSAALRARGDSLPTRWLMADRFFRTRWRGIRIPDALVAWLFRRIAHAYGTIVVPRLNPWGRAVAVRRAAATLRDPLRPHPVAVTPEAALGSGPVLVRPVPNSAVALAWLSRGAIPLVPVGVYEDDAGRLTARFGEPFVLAWDGLTAARAEREALTQRVMAAVAALLPPALHGAFAAPEASAGSPSA